MELRQKRLAKWLTIGFVTATFVLVCVLLYEFIALGNLSREKARLNDHLMKVTDQVSNYESLLDDMKDYNHLEDFARDNGWSRSGDIHFE